MLFTIIKEGKSWEETKNQFNENAKNNLPVKAFDPIVRKVVQDVRANPGMVSK